MLLINTLPAFAQATDIIPTGGEWESYQNINNNIKQPFDSLQAACEFDFNYQYGNQTPYPACRITRLTDKYLYVLLNRYQGFGQCNTERPKTEYIKVNGQLTAVCTNAFELLNPLSLVLHTSATCPAPANGQRAAADCTQTVSLTPAPGQTEPRPKGSEGDGKSTYDLIAKVTEGNKPKAGMALTFTVEVEPASGGLPTTPTGRPTGNLSIKSGTTNASGEVKVTFTSPIFSGTHKVKVSCTKCTGTVKEDTETFNVKVPNLILLPADSRWKFISNDNYHKNNNASAATRTVYYVTEQAKINLEQMVDALQTTPLDSTGSRFWGVIGLNDASLKWGGKFNAYVKKDGVYPPYPWNRQGQHGEHRLGVQIDLQTLYRTKEDSFVMYNRVCNPKADQYKVIPTILFHTGGSYHLHAYLLGNIAVNLGGGKCRTINN